MISFEDFQQTVINVDENTVNTRNLGIITSNFVLFRNQLLHIFLICDKFKEQLTDENQDNLEFLIDLVRNA